MTFYHHIVEKSLIFQAFDYRNFAHQLILDLFEKDLQNIQLCLRTSTNVLTSMAYCIRNCVFLQNGCLMESKCEKIHEKQHLLNFE